MAAIGHGSICGIAEIIGISNSDLVDHSGEEYLVDDKLNVSHIGVAGSPAASYP